MRSEFAVDQIVLLFQASCIQLHVDNLEKMLQKCSNVGFL